MKIMNSLKIVIITLMFLGGSAFSAYAHGNVSQGDVDAIVKELDSLKSRHISCSQLIKEHIKFVEDRLGDQEKALKTVPKVDRKYRRTMDTYPFFDDGWN